MNGYQKLSFKMADKKDSINTWNTPLDLGILRRVAATPVGQRKIFAYRTVKPINIRLKKHGLHFTE